MDCIYYIKRNRIQEKRSEYISDLWPNFYLADILLLLTAGGAIACVRHFAFNFFST